MPVNKATVAELLSPEEREVIDLTAKLWNAFMQLNNRPKDDTTDFRRAIHEQQRIILSRHPLTYASGYTLDLYCKYANPEHGFDAFPHTFYGENFKETKLDAIKAGWQIDTAARLATCPLCVRKIADWRRLNDST